MIQTGDPTGTGRGGASIYGLVWSLNAWPQCNWQAHYELTLYKPHVVTGMIILDDVIMKYVGLFLILYINVWWNILQSCA